MKLLAWLSATPEGSENTHGESLPEGSPFLRLPELGSSYYIISLWQDCGSVGQGSNGPVPLSWQEIRAWKLINNLNLTGFEISTMRKLSVAYVNAHYEASKKDSPPPWVSSGYDKAAAGKNIMSKLRGFNKQKEGPKYTIEE